MTAERSSNARTGGNVLQFSLDDEFAVFDRLPPAVRRCLDQAAIKFSALDLARCFALQLWAGDTATITENMALQVLRERGLFSERHQAEHGGPLPHVAAGLP